MKTLASLIVFASLIFSSIGNVVACTDLIIRDANGVAYQGRTNEFAGVLPDTISYFPTGSLIQSETPDGKIGMTFNTKYAFLAIGLNKLTPNSRQDSVHEGVNDQGMTFSTLAFVGNTAPKIDSNASKTLSVLDFGAWALGNFQNVSQVKQAIQNKEANIWLPRLAILGNLEAPLHFALFDKTGAGIVIEFTNSQTMVYDNPVGVMTNAPAFPWHLENLNNYAQLSNVDHNSGRFNNLKVNAPDSGNALAGVPSNQISSGRFVKAAFYSNYVRKAKTPKEAIQTLSHVMNNFDRPYELSIDLPGSASPGETSDPSKSVTEVTYFTVMNDLGQHHFYIRTINAINYSKIDLSKLAGLKKIKTVSTTKVDELNGRDATELFLK